MCGAGSVNIRRSNGFVTFLRLLRGLKHEDGQSSIQALRNHDLARRRRHSRGLATGRETIAGRDPSCHGPDKYLQMLRVFNTLGLRSIHGEIVNHPSAHQFGNQPVSRTRFVIGAALFAGGFLSPLLLPLVTRSDLPGNLKAILSTGLVAGLPEIGMLLAVAVLGKQGFAQLKAMFSSKFKMLTAPAAVSGARYRIGLVMFFAPLLFAWLHPYIVHFFPRMTTGSLLPYVLGDLLFASSFIVLGAGFWEKIHALFIHDTGRGQSLKSRSETYEPGETP